MNDANKDSKVHGFSAWGNLIAVAVLTSLEHLGFTYQWIIILLPQGVIYVASVGLLATDSPSAT